VKGREGSYGGEQVSDEAERGGKGEREGRTATSRRLAYVQRDGGGLETNRLELRSELH
jgi:hypothetical protein